MPRVLHAFSTLIAEISLNLCLAIRPSIHIWTFVCHFVPSELKHVANKSAQADAHARPYLTASLRSIVLSNIFIDKEDPLEFLFIFASK